MESAVGVLCDRPCHVSAMRQCEKDGRSTPCVKVFGFRVQGVVLE